MLSRIHESKATYTWYVDGNYKTTKYKDYDIILCGTDTYEEASYNLCFRLSMPNAVSNFKLDRHH